MKKSIKAIIAATFTAALLAGCSSNTASTTTAAETTAAETTTAEATTAGSADAADTALADGSYTIGINQFAVHGSLDNCREGFIEGLAENGFVEGKNLTVLEENAQADPGLAAQISTNFAGQKVDLICAIATPSAQSAYSVGRKNDIPVIYTAVTDPVAAELANADGTPCLIHQPRYNLLERWVEDGLLSALDENGVGCICFSPLAQGALTDKYLKGIPADSRASRAGTTVAQRYLSDEQLEKIKQLNQFAAERGQTLAQMAISWILRRPEVTTVLVGASRVSQLDNSLAALKNTAFSEDELKRIDEILA